VGVVVHSLRPYGRVLATRRARWTAAGGLVGRFREAGTGLALILLARSMHASFGVAGLAPAAYLAGAAVARPAHGRWVDRVGPRRPLLLASSLNLLCQVAAVLVALDRAPAAALIAVSATIGISLPALSAALRSSWPQLAPGDPDSAYALDTLGYELALVTAPALVGVLAVQAGAAVGLLAVAGLGMVGAAVVAVAADLGPPDRAGAAEHPDPLRRRRSVRLLILNSLLVGAAEGSMTVLAPGVATAHREPAAAGWLLSCLSAGSLVGALLYATLSGRVPRSRRLLAGTAALTAAFLALALLGTSPVGFAAAAGLVGLALSPTLTTTFIAIREAAGATALTEAFTWASFAAAAGAAASQATTGLLVGGPGVGAALWLPVAMAGAAALAAAAGMRDNVMTRSNEARSGR
jgi:predicted MFS family arabinose efflux permease